MWHKSLRISGLTIFFLLLAVSPFATAQTVTYELSVTIPAIPGFNVPPFEEPKQAQLERSRSPYGLELTEEDVLRGSYQVLLRTYVVR